MEHLVLLGLQVLGLQVLLDPQALVGRVVWVQQVLQDRVVPLVVEQLALQVHQDLLGLVAQQGQGRQGHRGLVDHRERRDPVGRVDRLVQGLRVRVAHLDLRGANLRGRYSYLLKAGGLERPTDVGGQPRQNRLQVW